MDDFDVWWDRLLGYRFTHFFTKFESEVVFCNPDTFQEYTLTHKFISSPNAFLGTDLDGKTHHIKILSFGNYNQLREQFQRIQKIQEYKFAWKLVKVLDLFELYNKDRWILIIVSEFLDCLTLEEISQIMKLENRYNEIAKETSIYLYLYLLNIIESSQKHNIFLNSVFPGSVLFVREEPTTLISIKNTSNFSYNVKISTTNKYSLYSGKGNISNYYPSENLFNSLESELWGLGLCLYALSGANNVDSLPILRELSLDERIQHIDIRYIDPALKLIIQNSLCVMNKSPIDSKIVQIWWGLWINDWDAIKICTHEDLDGLFSGLLFESSYSSRRILKQILSISDNLPSEVSTYIMNNNLLQIFIQKCINYDWKESPQLIDAVFKVLNYPDLSDEKARKFNESLIECGILEILDIAMGLSLESYRLLHLFMLKIKYSNTLSALQSLWENRMIFDFLKRAENGSEADLIFIQNTLSCFGPNSVDFIRECYKRNLFNESVLMQGLIEIPYYFKLEKLDSLCDLLKKFIINCQPKYLLNILEKSVFILEEVVCYPVALQYDQLIGKCSSHTVDEFATLFEKHPMLLFCENCRKVLCANCSLYIAHTDHEKSFLLYQSPYSRCDCEESHTFDHYSLAKFKLPFYSNEFSFVRSDKKLNREANNIFNSEEELTVMTNKSIMQNNKQGTIAYFEIKIIESGLYEDVVIELQGARASYYGKNGYLKVKDQIIKGPRYGSWDIVGIGMTYQDQIYITYNGLLIPQFIDTQPDCDIFACVTIKNRAKIEFKLRDWLFKPDDNFSNNKFYSEDSVNRSKFLLEGIVNHIKKGCKKICKDKKFISWHEKFVKLLETLNLNDLKEKAIMKKKKFLFFTKKN
ncbi:unnamed protein product [Blepharisma stoltei]|uniref:B box-type domain-containing protein n=1 Tax=Blepharisma stoltei TaxID=1481888 RepID=A0AAU9JYG3_9CILI|nr:unnamed protein product [Blepharisma stoltei]